MNMKHTTSVLAPFFGIIALLVMTIQPTTLNAEEGDVFRHIVLFKFKEDASAEKVKEIETAFAALPEKIDSIIEFEWGPSESLEGKNDGFTHCFLVSFKDKAGLEAYVPHPAHQAFVALLKPSLEKALVFDYTPQD